MGRRVSMIGRVNQIRSRVDDVITRGDREVTKKFWKKMEERWKIKSWGIVTEDKPRVYCSKKIGMHTDELESGRFARQSNVAAEA